MYFSTSFTNFESFIIYISSLLAFCIIRMDFKLFYLTYKSIIAPVASISSATMSFNASESEPPFTINLASTFRPAAIRAGQIYLKRY